MNPIDESDRTPAEVIPLPFVDDPPPFDPSHYSFDVTQDDLPAPPPPKIGVALLPSIERAKRRADGTEKPIPLPWRILETHFGGGLWPGLHIVNSGTGVGKTQFALQLATTSAKRGMPVLYIGLELGELDLALRLLGEEARVPWSSLWTGQAGPKYIERVEQAVPSLADIPFHYEVARPHGFPSSAIRSAIERVRAIYPEPSGPGSAPLLVVIDFLQLVGEEALEGKRQDLRERIGRASYVCRDAANRLNVSVLGISSVARERYKLLTELGNGAELAYSLDDNDRPIDRRILNTDAIVGAGKESGEIEFSADSVSIIAKASGTWTEHGCDVVFATAKGRATGAAWSPLHFTGYRYEQCVDEGAELVASWKDASRAREEKQAAKEGKHIAKIQADVDAVRIYILAHPNCTVTEARLNVLSDNSKRWAKVIDSAGAAIVQTRNGKRLELSWNGGS